MDGHDFATAAVKAGASLLVVAEGKLPALGRLTAPMIVVPDVLAALEKAGAAARARTKCEDHRRHRLGRKDQHQGSAAPRACLPSARCMPRQPRSTTIGACR